MRTKSKPALRYWRRIKSGLFEWRKAREHVLHTRPRKILGVAQILDFGNTMRTYPTFATANEADAHALRSDWAMVGLDIRHAIDRFERKESTALRRRKN